MINRRYFLNTFCKSLEPGQPKANTSGTLKKKPIMRKPITKVAIITLALAFILIAGCKKKEEAAPDLTRKATLMLSGSHEVPANSSTGSGTGQVTYDPTAKTLAYTFSWQLGSATATTTNMHFHGADDGSDTKSSGVVIGITGFATTSSGTLSGTTRVLTDVEAAQLLAGKWYLNIHSSTVGSGELRANMKF